MFLYIIIWKRKRDQEKQIGSVRWFLKYETKLKKQKSHHYKVYISSPFSIKLQKCFLICRNAFVNQ